MQTLALAMQDTRGEREVQVARRWAAEQIASRWRDRKAEDRVSAAEAYLAEEELDSGIVVKRGNDIRFWHLTFQEYLSARALGALPERAQNELLLSQPAKLHSPEWREIVLLFAGVLHRQGPAKADGMIAAILDGLEENAPLAGQARCAGLLGAIMHDLEVVKFHPEDPRYPALLERVMAIFDREKSRTVPIRDAIAAAEALGQAGDSRFEKRARAANWVKIEACEFRLGETKTTVSLGAYSIGRYPVTVQEYAEFVEDGGYKNAQWWAAGGQGKWREPEDWEDQIAHPNRPVVGVSWYEATAFCCWRTDQLHSSSAIPQSQSIHLPAEAEWERAAAGLEHRIYPWGSAPPDERLANYEMKVGAPTPVGIYPRGATPDGIADLAGNVWEWCENWYDVKTKQYRVLRGGSWINDDPEHLRCSYRNHDPPTPASPTLPAWRGANPKRWQMVAGGRSGGGKGERPPEPAPKIQRILKGCHPVPQRGAPVPTRRRVPPRLRRWRFFNAGRQLRWPPDGAVEIAALLGSRVSVLDCGPGGH